MFNFGPTKLLQLIQEETLHFLENVICGDMRIVELIFVLKMVGQTGADKSQWSVCCF